MILRGAQLTERRRSLAPTGPSAGREKSAELGKSASSSALPPLLSEAKPAANERREHELTFERVVAWLAVQNDDVKKDCAAVLATQVTKTYENAKQEGFLEGRKSGERAAEEEAARLVTLLQQIALNAQQAFDQEEQQLQNDCVEVVGEALAKIAGPALATERAAIGAIREVLLRVKEGRELTIRVSRDDLDALRKLENRFADLLGNRIYEFVADARVELGGCIVETKLGSLDGRFEVQLRELYETLRLAKSASVESA